MRNKVTLTILSLLVIVALSECNSNKQSKEDSAEQQNSGTPVTTTSIGNGTLTESIELNATSIFLLKTFVKSSVNGYIESSFVQPGQYVPRGAKLFILKTKEAHNLGNTISRMDSTFHFSGRILIHASGSGYITTLNYHSGDYVADGEQLAVISNLKSFAFLLELPYDLKSCLASNKQILLKLSDGTILNGRATSTMPSVDPVSQTLSVVIKVN
ncbi:MAG: efflux RND transporter periplasmic adaptor subunit, partial [Bacteroidota bacterium]|nr:efflux RND transporter periplasmic adaptor subunit [Bacteroidota bacterium]